MANEKAIEPVATRVDREKIQIEFVIDDLVQRLVKDRDSLIAAACNGCNSCSATLEKKVNPR